MSIFLLFSICPRLIFTIVHCFFIRICWESLLKSFKKITYFFTNILSSESFYSIEFRWFPCWDLYLVLFWIYFCSFYFQWIPALHGKTASIDRCVAESHRAIFFGEERIEHKAYQSHTAYYHYPGKSVA